MESPPELPFCLITEILSYLPVESLLRFKCVCRQWYSSIQDPDFMAIHNRRATPVFLPHAHGTIDRRFLLVDSFSGLLLEKNDRTQKCHIRNPAIRRVLDLPDPRFPNILMVPAFNWRTSECKLLAQYFLPRIGAIGLTWEILSVGRDEHWRALEMHRGEEVYGQPVKKRYFKTDRSIHCVRIVKNGQDLDLRVVSLDIWRESFEAYTLPRGFFSDLFQTLWFLWDNYVSVADIRYKELHVLVLKEHKEDKYNKIIVPLRILEENGYAVDGKLVRVEGTSDDLWLHYQHSVKLRCDAKTGRIKERIVLSEERKKRLEYRPSLVRLRGMRPEDHKLQG